MIILTKKHLTTDPESFKNRWPFHTHVYAKEYDNNPLQINISSKVQDIRYNGHMY